MRLQFLAPALFALFTLTPCNALPPQIHDPNEKAELFADIYKQDISKAVTQIDGRFFVTKDLGPILELHTLTPVWHTVQLAEADNLNKVSLKMSVFLKVESTRARNKDGTWTDWQASHDVVFMSNYEVRDGIPKRGAEVGFSFRPLNKSEIESLKLK